MKERIVTGVVFTLAMALFVLPGLYSPVAPLLLLLLVPIIGRQELMAALDPQGQGQHRIRILEPALPVLAVPFVLQICQAIADGRGLSSVPFLSLLIRMPEAGAITPVSGLSGLGVVLLAFLCILPMAILIRVLRGGTDRFSPAASQAAATVYVVVPAVTGAALLYTSPKGIYWLIAALLLPWVGDVAAYFTGLLCGRHKIIPELSPKKSAEGCVGGLLGSMAFFLLWIRLVLPGGAVRSDAGYWILILGTGLVGGLAAQAGDWFASAVKRWRGIKDFGSILPGHGGVLDRFDSVLFTLPVVYTASLLFECI